MSQFVREYAIERSFQARDSNQPDQVPGCEINTGFAPAGDRTSTFNGIENWIARPVGRRQMSSEWHTAIERLPHRVADFRLVGQSQISGAEEVYVGPVVNDDSGRNRSTYGSAS